jgi:ABC-type cobalamin/Fe3+-siderophores transport system ATPase subunit
VRSQKVSRASGRGGTFSRRGPAGPADVWFRAKRVLSSTPGVKTECGRVVFLLGDRLLRVDKRPRPRITLMSLFLSGGKRMVAKTTVTSKGVNISVASTDDGLPQVDAECGRITVVLGANGAGKSRLLRSLSDQGTTNGGVFIEGLRVVQAMRKPRINPLQRAPNNWTEKLKVTLDRIERPPNLNEYVPILEAWVDGGSRGPRPERPKHLLKELFRLFEEVFPEISLDQNDQAVITATRRGKGYTIEHLSDGEKQVFGLLATVVFSEPAKSRIFLVDEPEVFLHPSLADTFWAVVEDHWPDARFVYATHSLAFAMRPVVETVIVLSKPHKPSLVHQSIDGVPSDQLRPFLGAMPAILKKGKALATEGKREAAFDEEFYRWVLDQADTAVVPLGSCENVVAATKHVGIWTKLAPGTLIRGVIDRDYRSDDELQNLGTRCLPLSYHEAESYLCEPTLLAELAMTTGTPAEGLSEHAALTELVRHCAEQLHSVAGQRAIRQMRRSFDLFIKPDVFNGMDEMAIVAFFKREAEKAAALAGRHAGEVEAIFKRELLRCRSAVERSDVAQMLTLFPGKELAEKFAKRLGFSGSMAMLRFARRQLEFSKYPSLVSIRDQLTKTWEQP